MHKLNLYKETIDAKLKELIPEDSPYFASLYKGGRYSLLAPGKRIRPLLTLCTAEIIKQGSHKIALLPACALEMVHCYSLIHDDLPCMDDDDFRRGLPTLHRVYNEGHAVLVGDYLLTYAFELLTQAEGISAEQKVELIKVLSRAAGGEGMIGGQVMDIEGAAHIEEMHTRKTAALFAAALSFGAIITNASPQVIETSHLFGLQFGKLFQMVDDLLDADHPLGQDRAKQEVEAHFEASLSTLKALPYDTELLEYLTETVFQSSCLHTSGL